VHTADKASFRDKIWNSHYALATESDGQPVQMDMRVFFVDPAGGASVARPKKA
jgi:hypothetical protein